jgi:hypothetical protein
MFSIAIVPSFVVLMAGFLTGLGFFIRDLKYAIRKTLNRRTAVVEE